MRAAGYPNKRISAVIHACVRKPAKYAGDEHLAELAQVLLEGDDADALRREPVPHAVWGRELLDAACLKQFDTACRLPVAVRGAQMPDGHVGYGLPIGGVLATHETIIPYGVGVDIGCRMRLTVYGDGTEVLADDRERLRQALRQETRFGVGAHFEGGTRRHHAVLDDPRWQEQKLLRDLRDRAWDQLGTSGSGNHFVEFGELESELGVPEIGLAPGRYLALLSHSGSRGLGARIADHFTKQAMARRRLPPDARHLAWLDLKSSDGEQYWRAMNLAGEYAKANHELIHRFVSAAAGLTALGHVENHHNFAWRERHGEEDLIVHRKGATPAGAGVLGVIPGSMGDPGYVVRGKGNPASLHSAAHGAGRVMSRKQAVKTLTVAERSQYLKRHQVELMAGGLDESPQVYKPIDTVMAQQADLVEIAAAFRPRLVLMAAGGPAED
jgi:tRNA-splicing ligase RtcB